MKKRLLVVAAVAVMSTMMSITAFAAMGSWQSDETGWWWHRNDGSYPANEWKWIDGNGDGTVECYYFNENGYLAVNTTVDGSAVNTDGAWVENGVVQTRQVALDLGDEVLAAQTATQTNTVAGSPVMDGKSIEQIVLNTELANMISTNGSLDLFPVKTKIADGSFGPTVTADYKGKPITIETSTKYNRSLAFIGVVDQVFNNVPSVGIEMNAFYDNTGYETNATRRKAMASTGRSDEIFGLPGGSYRMAWGDVGERHFEILLTAGEDGKWYIYPDSKVFLN